MSGLAYTQFDSGPFRIRFYTNQGGVSKAQYASLNCGFGSDDAPENVAENRARVASDIGVAPDRLICLFQHHSADVLAVSAPLDLPNAGKADGMVTQEEDLALGILTADCGPVLLCDPTSGVIGAVHSGWRGAVRGINSEVVTKMVEQGACRDKIEAYIGPMIQQPSYEVGEDVRQQILDRGFKNESLILRPKKEEGKFYFDLPGLITHYLEQAQISKIVNTGIDTYAEEAKYFSYRRNTHRNIGDYGRGISVICRRASGA